LYLTFKNRESKTIDKQIDRLIREAIAEANRKALRKRALALKSNASPKEVAAAVAKEPVSSSRIALTPEDKLIADSF
jgi:hypothetical protein